MKARTGKLKFDRPPPLWIDQGLTTDIRIELLALSPRIVIGAADLEWEHGDPADRFVVATAQLHECQLVTSDRTIVESRLVRCVWD